MWTGAGRERVRIVRGDEPGGKASALNAGVRAARGDVLVFADSGQRFGPDAIALLTQAVMRPGVGAASGRLELARGSRAPALPLRLYWALERWLRRREAQVHSAIGVTGAIYAMRRSLWTPLPAGLILDDLYVPMQLVLSRPARGLRGRSARVRDARHDRRERVPPQGAHVDRCPPAVRLAAGDAGAAAEPGLGAVRDAQAAPTAHAVLGAGVRRVGRGDARAAVGLVWLLAGVAAFAALLQLRSKPFRMLRSAVVSSILIQVATVRATANGARGRWDVWHA